MISEQNTERTNQLNTEELAFCHTMNLSFASFAEKGKLGEITPVRSVNAQRDVEASLPSFLTSALYGVEWSASSPGGFNPGQRSHNTQ